MLPQIIKDAIIAIEGKGYAGIIDKITWPKLARQVEDFRAGGMFGTVEVDLGQEKMELSFEAPEQTRELLTLYGSFGVSGVRFRINASAESEADNSGYGIEALMMGRMKEVELGDFEAGKLQKTKYTVSLTTFKYSIDGRVLFDIDFVNNIYIVDGVDLLEKRRANLKM